MRVATTMFMSCVSISFLHCLSALRCHVRADALDLACHVWPYHMLAPPGQLHRFLDASGLAAAFSVMCFALYGCGAFSIFALFTLSLSYCSVSLDCEVHVLHDHHHLLSLRRCADDGKFVLQFGLQLPSVLPPLLDSTGSFLSVTGRGLLALILVLSHRRRHRFLFHSRIAWCLATCSLSLPR